MSKKSTKKKPLSTGWMNPRKTSRLRRARVALLRVHSLSSSRDSPRSFNLSLLTVQRQCRGHSDLFGLYNRGCIYASAVYTYI